MLYQEALANLTCFIKSVPRRSGSFQIVLGCDAKLSLSSMSPLQERKVLAPLPVALTPNVPASF